MVVTLEWEIGPLILLVLKLACYFLKASDCSLFFWWATEGLFCLYIKPESVVLKNLHAFVDFSSCSKGMRKPIIMHRPDLLWRNQRTKKPSLFFIIFLLKKQRFGEVRARTFYIHSLKNLTQFVPVLYIRSFPMSVGCRLGELTPMIHCVSVDLEMFGHFSRVL